MQISPTTVVAGNWKMHGSLEMLAEYLTVLAQELSGQRSDDSGCATVALFPPVGYLQPLQAQLAVKGLAKQVVLGAQDLHPEQQGAFTGDVSGAMLRDLGAAWVLVGHSERRQYHLEDDQLVARKAVTALASSLTPVICVGETAAQRDAGEARSVVEQQLRVVADAIGSEGLSRSVVAYEPVWAIGTGRSATAAIAQEMHAALRVQLVGLVGKAAAVKIPLLYGGSVKSDNAAELFAQPDIDGGLVGGASLDPQEFAAIIAAGDSVAQA